MGGVLTMVLTLWETVLFLFEEAMEPTVVVKLRGLWLETLLRFYQSVFCCLAVLLQLWTTRIGCQSHHLR